MDYYTKYQWCLLQTDTELQKFTLYHWACSPSAGTHEATCHMTVMNVETKNTETGVTNSNSHVPAITLQKKDLRDCLVEFVESLQSYVNPSCSRWVFMYSSGALSYYKQCECQLTGSLQAGLLFKPGPKVGGHLAPCCAHRMNQGELSQCCFQHDDSIINIVLVLLLNTYTNHWFSKLLWR